MPIGRGWPIGRAMLDRLKIFIGYGNKGQNMTLAGQSEAIQQKARTRTRPTKKQSLIMIGVAGCAALLLGVGGFSFVAAQEEQDNFCASCHTEPESTYYDRAVAAEKVDLATAHKLDKEIRCIDCHSGIGLVGRVEAQLMGARNAVMWYTGSATQPAPLTIPIGDDHCVKCHADVTTKEFDLAERSKLFGPRGHYHSYLDEWQAADPQATANCTTCHSGHELGANARSTWIVPVSVQNVCESCHKVLDEP